MKSIRNSIKTVICQNDSLLLIRKAGPDGLYSIFPGGGREKYEDMRSALRRECREEIDVEVIVDDLCWVREYIGRNHEFASRDAETQQIEFYFSCRLPSGAIPQNGPLIDEDQVGAEWVALADLGNATVYPRGLKAEFISPSRVYFGDIYGRD